VHLDPILDGLQTDFAMLFVNGMGQRINIDRVPLALSLTSSFDISNSTALRITASPAASSSEEALA
jgi:hypothetical protein